MNSIGPPSPCTTHTPQPATLSHILTYLRATPSSPGQPVISHQPHTLDPNRRGRQRSTWPALASSPLSFRLPPMFNPTHPTLPHTCSHPHVGPMPPVTHVPQLPPTHPPTADLTCPYAPPITANAAGNGPLSPKPTGDPFSVQNSTHIQPQSNNVHAQPRATRNASPPLPPQPHTTDGPTSHIINYTLRDTCIRH